MQGFPRGKTFYENQEFIGLSVLRCEISGISFQDCVFMECDFKEVQWVNCKFRDCCFNRCDLSLASVKDSQFKGVRFKESNLMGVNWAAAAWPRVGGLERVDFTRCVLNYASFFGLRLKGRKLAGCTALESDFAEADLTGADCTQTDFQRSRFLNTNLTRADFTGAKNYSISPLLNQIQHAKFALPEALSLLYNLEIHLVA